jgi:hypothetical protein
MSETLPPVQRPVVPATLDINYRSIAAGVGCSKNFSGSQVDDKALSGTDRPGIFIE